MTLSQLEYIVAVETHRSFVAAAEKCFVTQPTLSMQVQKLEDTLGVKIFDRATQPVKVTEIGAEIIGRARSILAERDKIRELISDRQKELSGELRIGIIPTIAPYLLPRLLSGFITAYPKVKLSVWELTTSEIVQQLKTGLVDCGILSTPLHEPALAETPLFYEHFIVYVSKGNKLSLKKEVAAAEIDIEETWVLNEGHCMREQVLNICQRRRHTEGFRHFEYNTGSIETLKRMVDENQGITILPELSRQGFDAEQLSRVIPFQKPVPCREIGIVTRRNFTKRRLVEALRKQVLTLIPEEMLTKEKKEVVGFQ